MHTKHVVVGLSGGVDSAVTACLLQQAGHRVTGVYMRNWHDDHGHCPSAEDAVCAHLGIALQTVDFSQAYMDKVFVRMLADLQQGLTPNPDILCNEAIKFKVLLDYAMAQGADYLATGHYATLEDWHGHPALASAIDTNKDQTYFLCRMPRDALTKVLFPIGGYKKSEIRALAQQYQLDNARKKDSTGICFIGERRFQHFISEHLLDKPGDIVDENQRVLGQHRGLFYYTLGQRKGLGLGGKQAYAEAPWFVLRKDMANNRLLVGQGDQHPALFRQTLTASRVHWLTDAQHWHNPQVVDARIRHRQPLQTATVRIEGDCLHAHFASAQRAITAGQSIAIYRDGICIASAIIED